MFNSAAYGGQNLLFKDSTTELVPILTPTYQAWLGDEYLHAMQGLDCDPQSRRHLGEGVQNWEPGQRACQHLSTGGKCQGVRAGEKPARASTHGQEVGGGAAGGSGLRGHLGGRTRARCEWAAASQPAGRLFSREAGQEARCLCGSHFKLEGGATAPGPTQGCVASGAGVQGCLTVRGTVCAILVCPVRWRLDLPRATDPRSCPR